MTTLMQIAIEIGELVERKREIYGDSITSSAAILAILYPNGVPLERYNDMLLTARILDKLQRKATGHPDEGDDTWPDIAGYGIRGAEQHQRAQEKHQAWPGSVSGGSATGESKAPSASAAESASRPTITSAAARSENSSTPPSRSPSESTSGSTAAPARSVTERASRSQVALAGDRNMTGKCGSPNCASVAPVHCSTIVLFEDFGAVAFCHVGCYRSYLVDARGIA
jgi:hypothetical protein